MRRAVPLGLVCAVLLLGTVWADWKSDANARIEQIRKRDAKITVVDPAGNPISGVTVNVQQLKHKFGFGSAICYQADQTYYSFFKDHFEWAVVQNELKWGHNEPAQGDYHYNEADFLVNYCISNSLKIRGHNIYWSGSTPSWVWPLSGSALQSAMSSRAASVVGRYKGKLEHWDVYNEMLSDTFFNGQLGNSIRPWTFQQARQYDPNVKLFVNEVGVENSDTRTNDLVSLVQYLLNNGADVEGIGLEAHMTTIDPVAFKAKLDLIGQFGIPIWITEFTSDASTDVLKADTLEQVYRTAFSHPMVEGALMWGFWEGAPGVPGWYIVKNDWTLNTIGQRYFGMINEWTTHTTPVSNAAGEASFRGFQGTYKVTLTKNGKLMGTQTVELLPGTTQAVYTVATAMFCDDFEAGTVDAATWDTTPNDGALTQTNGNLTLASLSSNQLAAIFSKTKVLPQGTGSVTLSSSGVKFGYYQKGVAWGFKGIYDNANYIQLYINDDNGALEIQMCKTGFPKQVLVIGDNGSALDVYIPFEITWSPSRVMVTRSGAMIFDSSTMMDSEGYSWDIPTVPMAAYARSGWNQYSISFADMLVQSTGTVDIYSTFGADGFEDGALDSSLWKTTGNLGTITESNSTMKVASISSNSARLATTAAFTPNSGTVIANSTGLVMGYYLKGNRWGFSTPSESDYIFLLSDWNNGGFDVLMRKAGGTTQSLTTWTGSLAGSMTYSICWSSNRVVVWGGGGIVFDSSTMNDSTGAAWNIPTVPMEAVFMTGYNANSITMNDFRIDTFGAVDVFTQMFTDDFGAASVNTSFWDTSWNLGTVTQSGGYLTLQSAGSSNPGNIRSVATVDVTDNNKVLLTSKGINFGSWLKGNMWGFRSDDSANVLFLETHGDTGNLMVTMRSNGGALQTLTVVNSGNLVAYVPYEIRWTSNKVVVTRGGATIFDSAVNMDSGGLPWTIPTAGMKVCAFSGYNSNSESFTDMSLQVLNVPEEEVGIPGDVNGDSVVNVADIDALYAAIAAGSTASVYDLDGNGSVAKADVDYLIHTILGTAYGDANLDKSVDVGDLGILAANYGGTGKTWSQGDFNGDGLVDVGDLGILAANYGTNASSADWAADYAKVFGTSVTDDTEQEETAGTVCSALGLPLLAGFVLMGLMIIKLEE
jgi:GH35 family endo-1,4-beta-xylanase